MGDLVQIVAHISESAERFGIGDLSSGWQFRFEEVGADRGGKRFPVFLIVAFAEFRQLVGKKSDLDFFSAFVARFFRFWWRSHRAEGSRGERSGPIASTNNHARSVMLFVYLHNTSCGSL